MQLYRDAHVALVTPLRDGMNLVAKEFVACQVGDPGVLVLSRFAGASETMREALLVNPYNIDATADADASRADDGRGRAPLAHGGAALARAARQRAWRGSTSSCDAARARTPAFARPAPADFDAWLGWHDLAGSPRGAVPRLRRHPCADLRASGAGGAVARRCAARCAPARGGRTSTWRSSADARWRDLQAMVGEPGLTYAGNHGLEIAGTGAVRRSAIPDLVPFRRPARPRSPTSSRCCGPTARGSSARGRR